MYTSNTLVFKNGILLRYLEDYTIINDTINYITELLSTDNTEIIHNDYDVYYYDIVFSTYTLTSSTEIKNTTLIFKNGVKLINNNDYTYSGKNITFITQLTTQDYITIIDYEEIYVYNKEFTGTNLILPTRFTLNEDSFIFKNGQKLILNTDYIVNVSNNSIAFNTPILESANISCIDLSISYEKRVPTNLLVYKPEQTKTALCWKSNPELEDSGQELTFIVEVDVNADFNTINKKVYTKDNVYLYEKSLFFNAFILKDLNLFEDQDYYFRVKCIKDTYISNWSESYKFTINAITWYNDTENIYKLLPDNYAYTKVGQTLTKKILELYMRLIGIFKNEYFQVFNNFNYKKIQNDDMYDLLGILLSYTRNTTAPYVVYKYQLLGLWQCFLKQGTTSAIIDLIKLFYGTTPEITILKNDKDLVPYTFNNILLSNTNLDIDPSENMPPINFDIGTKYYNNTCNTILEATETNSWNNAIEYNPSIYDNYQLQSTDGLCNYHFTLLSSDIGQTFTFGMPGITQYYLNEQDTISNTQPNPYLYTYRYLATHIILTINNFWNINLDTDVLMTIINELKPLNISIEIQFKTEEVDIIHYYGTCNYFGLGYYYGEQ